MKKIIEEFKKHYKSYIIAAVCALLGGIACFLLNFFLKNMSLLDAINGITIGFAVLLGVGILMWVGNKGAFDLFVYGFKQLGTAAFSKKPNKYHDYGTYSYDKRTSRKEEAKIYLPVIIVGLLFGVVLLILEIVIHTK